LTLRKLGVFRKSIFQEPLGFTWGWLIPSGNQTWLWKMVLNGFNGKISIYKWWMSHCHVPPLPCLMGGYIKRSKMDGASSLHQRIAYELAHHRIGIVHVYEEAW